MCTVKKGGQLDPVVPWGGPPRQFMAVSNFKLAEPIKICREQLCMDREMDKLHQEFLDCGIYQIMQIYEIEV